MYSPFSKLLPILKLFFIVAASRSRGKREAIPTNLDKENEVLLSVVGFHEPEQCIRRLVRLIHEIVQIENQFHEFLFIYRSVT